VLTGTRKEVGERYLLQDEVIRAGIETRHFERMLPHLASQCDASSSPEGIFLSIGAVIAIGVET
jgi:hypothetical protein